jgi:enterochelin esterase-like enzyme
MIKSWINGLCLLMLVGCSGGGGDSSPDRFTSCEQPVSRASIRYEPVETFHSTLLDAEFPVYAYFPANWPSAEQALPVIYVLDGEWHFDSVAEAVDALMIPAIVIGIGNDDSDGYAHRERYFRLPDSPTYLEFLLTEFLPEMEQRFEQNALARILVGHSYSGLFVAQAPFMRPESPEFYHYVSFDGSFWAHQRRTRDFIDEAGSLYAERETSLWLIRALVQPANDLDVQWFGNLVRQKEFSSLAVYDDSFTEDHYALVRKSAESVVEALELETLCTSK